MSHFSARYGQGVVFLLAMVAGASLGWRLSPWLARSSKRQASAELSVDFPTTPSSEVTTTWKNLFGAAQKEIWLSAGRLESVVILQALDAAARRGVEVHLTLSMGDNSDPNTGTRAWLRDKTALHDVRITSYRFNGGACVVDGKYAIVTAEGLLAADASAEDGGVFLYATGQTVAEPLRERLRTEHAKAAAESGPQ
jgi:hypothetical protein